MKRRKFIQSTALASAVASALPLSDAIGQEIPNKDLGSEKELYELRSCYVIT